MINDVPEHVGALAVFNEPERIAPELKVVAALVNAVRPMAFNVDSPFHVGEQVLERSLAGLRS